MIAQTLNDIWDNDQVKDAVINSGFKGFREDYLAIHLLIRKYKPATFFEIGTCDGSGAKVIKNALGKDAVLFSLDLPTEQIHKSLRVGECDRVGKNCDLPFTQLRGDSMTFEFSQYPCEGYYIDGEHSEENVLRESIEILRLRPRLTIWHDSDIPEVMSGIQKAIRNEDNFRNFEMFRIVDTRITYAIR